MSNLTKGGGLPASLQSTLDAIKARGRFVTPKQIAFDLGISHHAAYMRFHRLKLRNLIRSSGVEIINDHA
jgi:hypothetical protein